jgi:hypothetical protein
MGNPPLSYNKMPTAKGTSTQKKGAVSQKYALLSGHRVMQASIACKVQKAVKEVAMPWAK